MSPVRAGAVALLVLMLAACGGASKQSTTASGTATTVTIATATTHLSTTTTATRHRRTSTTTRPAGPPSTPAQAPAPPPSGGASPVPPQAHAEIPALFTVTAGGALVPPTVSAPASLPVRLTVVSRDGRAHTAVLRSPVARTLHVPAGGRASVLITGLRPGTYALQLDGSTRGSLVIGVQPGP